MAMKIFSFVTLICQDAYSKQAKWVKVGELRNPMALMDAYIDITSIKRTGYEFTYMSSWRTVDKTGKIIGNPNNWSNARKGSGNCLEINSDGVRKKLIEIACKGVKISQAQRDTAFDDSMLKKKRDPITDELMLTIIWPNEENDDKDLVIRCNPRTQLDIYIDTDTYNSDNREVIVRWGNGIPSYEQWTSSVSNQALFVPSSKRGDFFNKIEQNNRLVFAWKPYSKVQQAVVFDLSKIKKYISFVRTNGTCYGLPPSTEY